MIWSQRLVALVVIAWSVSGSAAGYPERPLRYVIPSAAGGGPDVAARVVMAQLSRQLGQQIIIDNRAGASGLIGTDLIAKATDAAGNVSAPVMGIPIPARAAPSAPR